MLNQKPVFNRKLWIPILLSAAILSALGIAQAQSGGASAEVGSLMQEGKMPEARARVEQALASNPEDPQLRFYKGVIANNLGSNEEAIQVFSKLTQDYPLLPEPYNNLAVIYSAQGQMDKARIALEQAIKTNPSYATAHNNLGDVYTKLASVAYTKALQLDTGNQVLRPKLALIEQILDPNAQARLAAAGVQKPTARPAVVASRPDPAPAPAASAPAPAPTPAPVAAANDADLNSVRDAVNAWANAWQSKNMNAYINAYEASYTPGDGLSHSAWREQRNERIMGKNKISVQLSNINVKVNGDRATASFNQSYRADGIASSGRKVLELARVGSGWKIVREAI